MNKFALSLSALALGVLVSPAFANPLTYPGGGQAPQVPLYATGTSITLYFDGASASFTDTLNVYELAPGSTLLSSGLFNNQTTSVGTSVTISVTPGDQIYFGIDSPDGDPLASLAADSSDSTNHAWITPFSGSVGNHSGLNGYYVGFEDISPLGSSDLDYNDETFVVTGVTATPEPSSLALLGTSILGAAGVLRRRLAAR